MLNSVASTGNLELLKKLHKEGCDLDSIDYLGRGILHVIAGTCGREAIAEYLCSQNINLDLLDNKARSALYLAVEADNFGVANILATKGASIIADDTRIAKMLCMIGFENDMEKLRFLVKSDCDIDNSDYDKRTIGHLAAAEGNIEMLEFLATSSSFDFSLKDRWNNSVLGELKDEEAIRRIEQLVYNRSTKAGSRKRTASDV